VPYWWVDTAFAAMLAQLAAVDAGLGSCFFGLFEHEGAVLAALGVPPGWRAVGTIAVGWPDPERDRPSRSATRGRPEVSQVLHRDGW
jgi:nitroreductase